jgi:undecaprenyl-diphosphatase
MSMFWVAVILGVVEGLTEFLPISSTGHLIVTNSFLEFHGKRAEVFAIFIQLGAILSVVWEYRERLFGAVRDLPRRREAQAFGANLFLAFLPAAVVGLLVHDWISDHLFRVPTVAAALIVGAVLILIVEAIPRRPRTIRAERVGWQQALAIGFAQCLALWPGFSRSAATILGGLGVGLDRRAATEFSFFLAIPTMFAATIYDLVKNRSSLLPGDAGWLALSFVISFVVAWASIRWLIRFVSTHSFRGFALYRIAVGVVLLVLAGRLDPS